MRGAMVVDNFAGGGGASLGIEQAIGRPVDVAVNHDAEAIAMHEANHPHTRHYHENIWQVDPRAVAAGRPVALAWFSPDCKHFSKAKGGKPVDKDIRGLAWVVIDWARDVRPDVIMLENVEEFRTWGPLDDRDMPDPTRRGETFEDWKAQLCALGYSVDYREMRASDYGAPTIRKRLFVVARRDGRPIVWPEATHGPRQAAELAPYRTAAECIDWSIPAPSIFERSKPLVENTLRRIALGIRRYVIEAEQPFIVRTGHYSNITGEGATFRGQGLGRPLSTVTSVNDYGLIEPFVATIDHQSSPNGVAGASTPLSTVTSKARHALVSPHVVGVGGRAGQSRPRSVAEPFATATAKADRALVAPSIVRMNHGDSPADSVEEPMRTVTTQHNHLNLVEAFLAQHNGGMVGREVDEPFPTATASGSQTQLVTSHLTKLYGTSTHGAPVDEPMPTVTGGGQHIAEVRAFLLKYYGASVGQPIDEAAHTITSRARLGLVTVAGVDWQIVDIGMRMLTPRELFRAQGFPEGYVIDPLLPSGKRLTKTAQIRMCGNSVCPQAARALVEANVGAVGQQHLFRGYELAAAGGGA